MKATLSFNLPEEQQEHILALNGSKLASEIQEFDYYLRGEIKYNVTLSAEHLELYEKIREKLHEMVDFSWY